MRDEDVWQEDERKQQSHENDKCGCLDVAAGGRQGSTWSINSGSATQNEDRQVGRGQE